MERKRRGGVRMLIGAAALTGLLGLLTGCGDKYRAEPVLTPDAAVATPGRLTSGAAGPELQSQKERQMVLLFRAILLLDRNPETAILPAQAAQMLPIVKQSVEEGQLGAADLHAVEEQLTPAQKAVTAIFLTPPARGGPDGDGKRREGEANPAYEETRRPPPPPEHPGAGSKPEEWMGSEKNVERQLIELLESKANQK